MTVHNQLLEFFHTHDASDVAKGKLVMEPSGSIENIFYLQKGYIRMFQLLANGKELTITIFKPGSFFPLFLAIDGRENIYYFDAFTQSVITKVPTAEVLTFVKNNPEVLLDFTRRTSRGMQAILANLQYQLFGTVAQRTVATLLMLAERFGIPSSTGVQIGLPVSHQDIANFVGVTRETISIEMKKLQKKGMINTTYKHIVIPDVQALVHMNKGNDS